MESGIKVEHVEDGEEILGNDGFTSRDETFQTQIQLENAIQIKSEISTLDCSENDTNEVGVNHFVKVEFVDAMDDTLDTIIISHSDLQSTVKEEPTDEETEVWREGLLSVEPYQNR